MKPVQVAYLCIFRVFNSNLTQQSRTVKYILKEVYILNKSENATLQLSIFYEKVLDKKYLLKLNNVSQTSSKLQQTIRRNSTNLSRLMSESCSFKCLKLYPLNFAIAHAQIKIVTLIKIGHDCVA